MRSFSKRHPANDSEEVADVLLFTEMADGQRFVSKLLQAVATAGNQGPLPTPCRVELWPSPGNDRVRAKMQESLSLHVQDDNLFDALRQTCRDQGIPLEMDEYLRSIIPPRVCIRWNGADLETITFVMLREGALAGYSLEDGGLRIWSYGEPWYPTLDNGARIAVVVYPVADLVNARLGWTVPNLCAECEELIPKRLCITSYAENLVIATDEVGQREVADFLATCRRFVTAGQMAHRPEEVQLQQRLAQPVDLHFDDVPFNVALLDIAERYGLNVLAESYATESKLQRRVTHHRSGDALGEAIENLIKPLGMTASVYRDGVIITDKAAANHLSIHSVGWLARAIFGTSDTRRLVDTAVSVLRDDRKSSFSEHEYEYGVFGDDVILRYDREFQNRFSNLMDLLTQWRQGPRSNEPLRSKENERLVLYPIDDLVGIDHAGLSEAIQALNGLVSPEPTSDANGRRHRIRSSQVSVIPGVIVANQSPAESERLREFLELLREARQILQSGRDSSWDHVVDSLALNPALSRLLHDDSSSLYQSLRSWSASSLQSATPRDSED